MKKVLAAVLAASTLMSVASVNAFAATNTVIPSSVNQLYVGLDGTLLPDPVPSDNSIYFQLGNTTLSGGSLMFPAASTAIERGRILADTNNFSFKFDKGSKNAKMIDSISVVEAKPDGSSVREWWVKIVLKEDMTNTEYKLEPTFTFTAKKNLVITNGTVTVGTPVAGTDYLVGDSFTFKNTIFMKNTEIGADADFDLGQKGQYLKPIADEENTVRWEDKNRTVATLQFFSDNSADFIYPKLITAWNNDVYAQMFADQNAFKFEFPATNWVASTSRATLSLYNPYIDEDGAEILDPETITIYTVDGNGDLVDSTADFVYGEDDNGNYVFTAQTRQLGYYIMAEYPLETEEDMVEEELVEEDLIEEPLDPDPGKEVPNTGSF